MIRINCLAAGIKTSTCVDVRLCQGGRFQSGSCKLPTLLGSGSAISTSCQTGPSLPSGCFASLLTGPAGHPSPGMPEFLEISLISFLAVLSFHLLCWWFYLSGASHPQLPHGLITEKPLLFSGFFFSRGGRIRTDGLCNPIATR